MGVQVVDDQPHILGIWVAVLNEVAEAVGEVQAGAPLGHRHMSLSSKRLDQHDQHEQIGCALPHVVIVPPPHGPGLRRQRSAHVSVQDHWFSSGQTVGEAGS